MQLCHLKLYYSKANLIYMYYVKKEKSEGGKWNGGGYWKNNSQTTLVIAQLVVACQTLLEHGRKNLSLECIAFFYECNRGHNEILIFEKIYVQLCYWLLRNLHCNINYMCLFNERSLCIERNLRNKVGIFSC